jgi:hypothetical protein
VKHGKESSRSIRYARDHRRIVLAEKLSDKGEALAVVDVKHPIDGPSQFAIFWAG